MSTDTLYIVHLICGDKRISVWTLAPNLPNAVAVVSQATEKEFNKPTRCVGAKEVSGTYGILKPGFKPTFVWGGEETPDPRQGSLPNT